MVGCLAPISTNVWVTDLRTSSALFSYAYGVVEYSCEDGQHDLMYGQNVRHLYTTGTGGTEPGDARTAFFGRTKRFLVVNSLGVNCQHAPFDTHADAWRGTFKNCTARYSHIGPSGTARGFNLRGIGHTVEGCVTYGVGFVCSTDFASPDNSRDHSFINCRHYGHPQYSRTRYPFYLNGREGGRITGVRIENPFVDLPLGNIAAVYASFGDAIVKNPDFRAVRTARGALITALDGSNIRGTGGRFDITGSPAANNFLIRADGTSAVVWSGSAMEVVTGGADLQALGDFGGNNGSIIIQGANLDATPSNVVGLVNSGGSVTGGIDYWINEGRGGHARARSALTYDTAGNQVISLVYRMAAVVYADALVTATGVVVTQVGAGVLDGQEIVIRNRTDSTQSLTVRRNTGRLLFDADAVLEPGQSLRLRYDMPTDKWVKS